MKRNKQIGCGYCYQELDCEKRDPKINKAEQGCKEYIHWLDYSKSKSKK